MGNPEVIWDAILSGANIVLAFGLLPTIFSRLEKPTLTTCSITIVVRTAIVIAFLMASLPLSAFGAGILLLGWIVLFIQKVLDRLQSRLHVI